MPAAAAVAIILKVRHRGITHTVVACTVLALTVGAVLAAYAGTSAYAVAAGAGVLAGYGMHLVADGCTPHGVPLFAPFSGRNVHLLPHPLRITTGSGAEILAVTLFVIGTALLVYHGYA